jgi:hypothetical protein
LGVPLLAAITGRRVTVTDLGRALKSITAAKYRMKRADRLFSNPPLPHERFNLYPHVTRWLVAAAPRPVVLVD